MESLEQKYAQTLENSNLSLKQRQVLLSSLKLFSEIGFENTTASLISKEAGVSEGTVFSYFKTKEGILEAILSTFLEQVIPDMIADFSEKKFTANQESFPLFLRSIVRDRLVFIQAVSYTHLRAHETAANLVCRLLLEKKKHLFIIYLLAK